MKQDTFLNGKVIYPSYNTLIIIISAIIFSKNLKLSTLLPGMDKSCCICGFGIYRSNVCIAIFQPILRYEMTGEDFDWIEVLVLFAITKACDTLFDLPVFTYREASRSRCIFSSLCTGFFRVFTVFCIQCHTAFWHFWEVNPPFSLRTFLFISTSALPFTLFPLCSDSDAVPSLTVIHFRTVSRLPFS